jgi:hypothetical protein
MPLAAPFLEARNHALRAEAGIRSIICLDAELSAISTSMTTRSSISPMGRGTIPAFSTRLSAWSGCFQSNPRRYWCIAGQDAVDQWLWSPRI